MAFSFNRKFDPEHGKAVAVAPLVSRIVCGNPGPFTFTGTNSYIVGADEVAIIDPGPVNPIHIEAILAAIGGRKVCAICVTHTHLDHSPAARILRDRLGAPVVGAGAHRPARLPAASIDAPATARTNADHDHRPDTELGNGAPINGDGFTLTAISTPGHTANHLAFALKTGATAAPNNDTLFSGDHVMGWSTSIVAPPDGHMADYRASLIKLRQRVDGRFLPGHGPAIDAPADYLDGLIAHRGDRERSILAQVQAGKYAISALVAGIYRDLDPQLTEAAALSVLAHLEDLVERGLVACEGPPGRNSRYEPVS